MIRMWTFTLLFNAGAACLSIGVGTYYLLPINFGCMLIAAIALAKAK